MAHDAQPLTETAEDGALRERHAALEAEAEELRAEVALAIRRFDALRGGRWERIGEELRRAARQPWRAVALPVIVGRIALSRDTGRLLGEGEHHLAAGRYDLAIERFDRALANDPTDLRPLQRKRESLIRLGELSAALAVTRQHRAVQDTPALRRAERTLAGRLAELDPGWLPDLPWRPERLAPASERRVLHLLKHTFPHHTSGYTLRSRYTVLAQRRAGLEPVVVTSPGSPRMEGFAPPDPVELVDDVPHHRLDLGAAFPYREVPNDELLTLSAWRAARVVRQVRPALIQARAGFRGYEIPLVALAIGRRFSLPVVYEVSSFLEHTPIADIEGGERGEHAQARLRQDVRCMTEADWVVTTAEPMRAEIISRGVPAERVSVIPNGVDAERFLPKDPDPTLVRQLGLTGSTVLGTVSSLVAREGLDVLLHATAMLRRRGLPVSCIVVGDGLERTMFESLVRELGLSGFAHIVGAVAHERIRDYYALMDVYVLPRRNDPTARLVTPLTSYEAMAMGKPVIVSALPALVELTGPPARGLSFEPGDATSLATEAERLLADPALGHRLGEQARSWVRSERTWNANGARYRELYQEIVARAASGDSLRVEEATG